MIQSTNAYQLSMYSVIGLFLHVYIDMYIFTEANLDRI